VRSGEAWSPSRSSRVAEVIPNVCRDPVEDRRQRPFAAQHVAGRDGEHLGRGGDPGRLAGTPGRDAADRDRRGQRRNREEPARSPRGALHPTVLHRSLVRLLDLFAGEVAPDAERGTTVLTAR
jgi:hypothetical protein